MKKILEDNCTTSTLNIEYGVMPCDGKSVDYLTAAGNKALADKIKAMREDELEVVVDNIPVEYCLKRIQKELDKAKELEKGLAGIIAKLGG